MTHSIRTYFSAWGALLLAVPMAWAQAPAAQAEAPAALDRPALMSPKSAGKAMLAVVQAGKRLVAAGERGIVQYSDDAGAHWQQAATPTSVTLVALRFVDDQRGWAVGHMGVVLHTQDAGQTWSKQLDGLQAARLVLEAAQKSGNEKAMARAERLLADGADKPWFDLYFENAQSGWVVGAFNQALRTHDGGKTWQPWQDHIDNPKALHLHAIRKVGSSLLLVGEQGLLLRSDDGGDQFRPLASPYTGTWFGLLATREDQVLAYGLRGNAFVSSDAGNHWTKLVTGTQVAISSATQLLDGRVLLLSQAGELLTGAADGSHDLVHLSGRPGLPLTDVVQTDTNTVALASLRGVVMQPLSKP